MLNQVKLYQIPEILETAGILEDSILPAYSDSIQNYNERARQSLGKFQSTNGQLAGSNPFMLVHLSNSGLLQGARLAERQDLEKAIVYDPEFVKGNWIDFGIALKTEGDSYKPNDLPARILAEKLNHKGISLDSGKLIPFNVLKNSEHDNSAYGLVFDLNDQFEEDSVRDLAEFKWDYARNEGISYAYLNGGRYWNYCYRDLDNSNGDARVVVVSGEATSKN